MSGVSGRSLLVATLVGVFCAAGALVAVDAVVTSSRADSDAVRVVGGCETVVRFESAGRYRLAVEFSGPAVPESDSCQSVGAGERSGDVDAVRVVAPDGAEALLVVSGDARLANGPGWERQRIGSLRVETPGDYVVIPLGDAVGGAVVTVGADAGSIRDRGLVIAAVLIAVGIVVGVVGRRRRGRDRTGVMTPPDGGVSRPVIPVRPMPSGAPWAPPAPGDRVG